MRIMKLAATSSILRVTSTSACLLVDPTEAYILFSQEETSEKFIGEWMEARGIRDQMVIATKVRLVISILGISC